MVAEGLIWVTEVLTGMVMGEGGEGGMVVVVCSAGN